jgi:predicted negative regulator of RcsB-dependent stress response
MSKFSTTVSTIAALGTIAATSITAYKVFDNQQTNSQKQQVIIEDLKQQLEAKKPEPITPQVQVVKQPTTPPVQVVQPPITPPPPVVPPAPELPIQQ